jgi:hypothetical protein
MGPNVPAPFFHPHNGLVPTKADSTTKTDSTAKVDTTGRSPIR